MERRRFLAGVAVPVATATAGCSVLGGGESGPTDVARTVVRAGHGGNLERVRDLLHPESTSRQYIESGGWNPPDGSVTLRSVEESELSENVTIVAVDYELSMDGEVQQRSMNVELQRYEGEWRVWGIR